MNATGPFTELLDEVFRRRLQIPLDEVRDITGYQLRSLVDDCRAGRLDHQWRHGKYHMTRTQVEKLLAAATRKAHPGAKPKTTAVEAGRAVDVEEWKTRKRASLARKAG